MKSFGSKELKKCLKKLGFVVKSTESSHIKFWPPKGHIPLKGVRPFQMVQLGKKAYRKNDQGRYISQIRRFGFAKQEIHDALKK